MKASEIEEVLKSFNISDEDIAARATLKEYAYSLSDVLIDEFYTQYLLPNNELMRHLENVDGARLLKVIKEFVVFIFNAPIDSNYFNRISKVGFIHYNIKLSPAKVSYGFWALNQLLNKMAEVNPVIKNSQKLISKFLALVEYVMNHSFYQYHEKAQKQEHSDFQAMGTLDELFTALNIHKKNLNIIKQAYVTKSDQSLEIINDNASKCIFGKFLEKFKTKSELIIAFGIDVDDIERLHTRWHEDAAQFKVLFSKNDDEAIELAYKTLQETTKSLFALLDKPLKDFSTNGFLSLNSGMKTMHEISDIFHQQAIFSLGENTQTQMFESIKEVFLNSLSWSIEYLDITSNKDNDIAYDLIKKYYYNKKEFFIGIKLKKSMNQLYLTDMLKLILDSLELHFSIKEREHSLMLFADKAESANKSKDIFLANMSHELRTPLNAITGFSQILMMRPDTPENVKGYVEKINVAGNNLLHLVNTILDFAKLEAGKMQFNPHLSNVATLVSEVRTLVTPMAQKKNITLNMPRIISLNLLLDPKLFQQVLINLLSNAIKFSADGSKVSLSITYEATHSSYRFEVCDSGVGISKEDQSKLFQAFSQVDNVYQKEQKGTGLGLMICKKIVEELHKGEIWVESDEGKGSCFFVRLPTPAIESKTFCVNNAQKGSAHILIVEDSESYQNLLIDHLQDTHRLTLTDSVNKAKNLLSEEKYNFVILDFFLTDGISSEVLEYMEDENIHVPTIVISAEDDINISNALSQSSNLESILNKDDVENICRILKDIKND